jgi:L-rhamnose mutarotase
VNQKSMIRKCFVMQLNRGAEVDYRKRHSPIWKELEDVLHAHGVHNYSIALHLKLASYAYAEIEDEPAGMLLHRRRHVAVGGTTWPISEVNADVHRAASSKRCST